MNDSKYTGATEAELGFLKEIIRMLPAGVTVQDERGDLLLVNDAAAAQLGMDGSHPAHHLAQRRDTCQRALRAGQAIVIEDRCTKAPRARCCSPPTGRFASPAATS